MKKIILARHGEGTGGQKKLVQSKTDLLTEKGIKQATELANYLKNGKINHIVSSPSFRTLQTATVVASIHELPVLIMDELIEIDFGSMKGQPAEDLSIEKAIELGHGENPELVFERVKQGWNKIINSELEGTILVVTYRSILSAIEAVRNGGSVQDFLNNRKDNEGLNFGYWKEIVL